MFRLQGSVNAAYGPALNGVDVYICTQPAVTTTVPPTPLATLYTDSTEARRSRILCKPMVSATGSRISRAGHIPWFS